jgi:hypothetical protein
VNTTTDVVIAPSDEVEWRPLNRFPIRDTPRTDCPTSLPVPGPKALHEQWEKFSGTPSSCLSHDWNATGG